MLWIGLDIWYKGIYIHIGRIKEFDELMKYLECHLYTDLSAYIHVPLSYYNGELVSATGRAHVHLVSVKSTLLSTLLLSVI